ncbi:hypothetical protein FACS189431_6660 [Alphaproteobacteria bacterium]|nr:hypothetical protein FACS189431_6660 [Alphaproteobacteria bacterium]
MKNRDGIIWCVILLVMITSCKVKKQSELYTNETGTAEMLKADSLRLERIVSDWAKRKLEVRHIAFTKPDSLDRLFISSITLLTAEEEAEGNASSSLQGKSTMQAKADITKEAILTEKTEAEKKSSPLFWAALIAALIVLAIAWRRNAIL